MTAREKMIGKTTNANYAAELELSRVPRLLNLRSSPHDRGASFRRAEVPFKSARATCSSRPTGLADGLELESTPTRDGESSPRHLRVANALVPPLPCLAAGIRLHDSYYRTPFGPRSRDPDKAGKNQI